MPNTKVRGRKSDARDNDPLSESRELQVRISCVGRSAAEALDEIKRALDDAALAGRDPLIVLEDLSRLRDSVAAVIKGLSRLLVGYPRTVTFWESSGYTEAFLSVMENPRCAVRPDSP